jgi:hypothetical protein
MFADRAYSQGLVASPDRLASLRYFAAAVPTIGFIHGAADLSPLNAAALEGCRRESIRPLVGNPPTRCGTSGRYVRAPPGRRTVNTEPLPISLVTVTSPPIMRASLRERARPSPVPP